MIDVRREVPRCHCGNAGRRRPLLRNHRERGTVTSPRPARFVENIIPLRDDSILAFPVANGKCVAFLTRKRPRTPRLWARAGVLSLNLHMVGALTASRCDPITQRYTIYGPIASGGMATVYYGRLLGDVGFTRLVAVKSLHPQFAADPEFSSAFLDEARVAARIRHPNVVSTLDVTTVEGEIFLVMEYVFGASLAEVLRRGPEPIEPAIASAILSGVLRGLHAAHEARNEEGQALGIIHRDVSPQNILVGADGVARILDFGGDARRAGRSAVDAGWADQRQAGLHVARSKCGARRSRGARTSMPRPPCSGKRSPVSGCSPVTTTPTCWNGSWSVWSPRQADTRAFGQPGTR